MENGEIMKMQKFDLKRDVYDAFLSKIGNHLNAKFGIQLDIFRTAFDDRYNQCRMTKLGN